MATNLLQDGAAWLGDRLKQSAGRSVTYCRKGVDVAITATIRAAEYEVVTEEGFGTFFRGMDFIVTAADLVIAGEVREPGRGDTILLDGDRYTVQPVGDRNCFEPHDDDKTQIVVHTKRTRESA